MKQRGLLKLLASIAIVWGAAAIGSVFTAPAIQTWYPTLRKPWFNPPNYIFGPVWTILYTLMGIALFLVWRKGTDTPRVKPALAVFGVQLGLNVLWSVLFFGLRSPLLGLIDIGLLWMAILATIILFFPISVPASLLLIPYVLWVSFAAVLNYFIVRLN